MFIYLLRRQNQMKSLWGGTTVWHILKDGVTFNKKIAFSNACVVLDKGQVPNGASLMALTVTHLKTNFPQEHHVFSNLSHGIILYVGAAKADLMYKISKGEIKETSAP